MLILKSILFESKEMSDESVESKPFRYIIEACRKAEVDPCMSDRYFFETPLKGEKKREPSLRNPLVNNSLLHYNLSR